MSTGRSRLLAAGLTFAIAVVAAVAAGLAIATSSHGAKPPSRDVYLARARAVCGEYSRKLDRIPPIQDPTLLGVVIESTNAALPILKEQAARIHALTPPVALRKSIERFFALTDRSLATLQSVHDAAKQMDTNDVSIGLIRFARETTAAKLVGRQIGYRC
jgi:hypothetical protein